VPTADDEEHSVVSATDEISEITNEKGVSA
jgi:hypothetical protein